MFMWKCMWISQKLFRQIIQIIMEAQVNNVTTVSLNKPINLFFSKRVLLFWHELSIQNLYRLSTFGCSYVLFKAILFSICSGKISCNNNLNSKLNLRKKIFQNLPTHKTSRGASFALYFMGREVKSAAIFRIVEVIFQMSLINQETVIAF